MATYTVRAGDTWTSLARKLGVDARTLRRRNRGTRLSRGVVIRTGGATAAPRAADINPWGLPAGQVPAYAAGTTAANTYLAAIGQPIEAPGVTPAGGLVSPIPAGPASTQLISPLPPGDVSTQQLVSPIAAGEVSGITPADAATEAAPTRGRLAAALAPTPVVEPQPTLGEPTQVRRHPVGRGAAPSLGFLGLGPVVEGLATGLGAGFEQIGEAFAPSTVQVMGGIRPPGEAGRHAAGGLVSPIPAGPASTQLISPTPSEQDTAPMPTGQYVSGRVAIAQAATWTARALSYAIEQDNRNYMPAVITSPVATLILSSTEFKTFAGEDITSLNELFADDALAYEEIEPGVWARRNVVTYAGGYTGAVGYGGRRYGRGRGARGGRTGGAGGTQYGPRLVQWRIAGFG